MVSDWSRFLAGRAQLAFFDDDFFYYLKIAANLAGGNGSTFDGIHLTNGYHPLWMLVLWGVCLLPQAAWLPTVTLLVCVSSWLCFLLARRVFRLVPCDPLLATAAAGLLGLMSMILNHGGMEITLALPLLFWLVYLRLTNRLNPESNRAALYGLLGASIILSRLDSILFLALLYAFEAIRVARSGHARLLPAAAARVLLGLLPIPLYLFANHHIFGALTPVSGQAKQLMHHPAFAISVVIWPFLHSPIALRLFVIPPATVFILTAASRLARRGLRLLEDRARPIVLSLLAFPVIHLLVLASLSDWPLWPWYMYSFVAAALGSLFVLFTPLPSMEETVASRPPRWAGVAASALLVALLCGYSAYDIWLARKQTGSNFAIYDIAVRLAAFSKNHPGIYAMGDRSGTPGYLLGTPMIQTEGLVMDSAYLIHVRRKDDLAQVLSGYNVRYYVGSGLHRQGGCYLAVEPAQAGGRSPKMKATLCGEPAAVWKSPGAETDVFDMTTVKAQ